MREAFLWGLAVAGFVSLILSYQIRTYGLKSTAVGYAALYGGGLFLWLAWRLSAL